MSRLEQTFAELRKERRPGLVTYVTAGDPDLARSPDVVRALARGGADVIEIGVRSPIRLPTAPPFSARPSARWPPAAIWPRR